MAVTKPVSFKNKEKDLVKYVEGKDFSYYVKELIRRDMNINNSHSDIKNDTIPVSKKKPKRILDYDM